ncbi:DUF3196 family protein [Spiroplasma chrysopicola]|uniref:Uncharacterized protein n=1 Tax=Spiroplasma chrysopicola DF-1 TaxID=1276227 RepID=R4U384_9MOLU|nr:DUF3196 family protein [Spiroplasma chrysopicola]AGM24958.1 hypothetical protein SCHRY_v1c03750 [Spiroplasma chrysopicola DF-1]
MGQDNYYDELLSTIKNLIAQGQYQNAQEKIKDELAMPYVPNLVEKELKTLAKVITSQIKYDKDLDNPWTPAKITAVLTQPLLSVDEFLMVVPILQAQNLRNFLPIITELLVNPAIADPIKVRVLFLLQEQEITTPIKVVKKKMTFTTTPDKLKWTYDDDNHQTMIKLFDEIVYNDNPSLYHLCLNLLEAYYLYRFPDSLATLEIPVLTIAIITQANKMLGVDYAYQQLASRFGVNPQLVADHVSVLSQIDF